MTLDKVVEIIGNALCTNCRQIGSINFDSNKILFSIGKRKFVLELTEMTQTTNIVITDEDEKMSVYDKDGNLPGLQG